LEDQKEIRHMTASEIRFGPFSLEREPARLMRGEDVVKLRPKSLDVLCYLAQRPGQLVGKQELLARVWTGRVITDTGLRICIGEIRAALGDDADAPHYLETMVGQGYRFLQGTGGKAPDPNSTGPIVGREAELRRLDELSQLAAAGHTQLVLLAGEPGIGKTTMVELFLDRISKNHDSHVIQGQCVIHYGQQEAYGPVLEAIATFFRDQNDTGFMKAMERHVPGWLLQLPDMLDATLLERIKRRTEDMAPERMKREFCQLVAVLAEKKPLVMVIEDLHWADVTTIDLLAFLAEHDELPLMILGTYRPADAVIYGRSLRDTVKELRGRGLCQELMLASLTETDLATYLAGRLNGEVSDDLIAGLYPRTGGNPLFMVKLVEELILTQALVCHNGLWCIGNRAGALEIDVPKSLQSLISRYLDAMPPPHKEMLEVASIIGFEFSAAAMTDALGKTIEEIESASANLSANGQFIEPGDLLTWPDGTLTGSFRFQHHLYLEVIYRQMAAARRARIHRKVGKRLEKAWGGDSREIAATLAEHFERGRDPVNAARYQRMAGEVALGLQAYPEAAHHLQAALEAFDRASSRPADGDPDDRVRWELEVCTALGTTLAATHGYSATEVTRINSRARSLIERIDDPAIQFPTLFNLWLRSTGAADHAESTNLVTRMSELAAGTENDELAMMYSSASARTQFYLGDLAGCAEHMRRILTPYDPRRLADMHRRYGVVEHAVACLGVNAWLLWLQGYPDQALAQTREARKLAERLDGPYYDAVAGYLALPTLQFCGDTAQLDRRASDLKRLCAEQGYALWLAWATCFEGWVAGARGNLDEGIALMERGVEAFRGTGACAHLPHLLALLAELCLRAGRIEAASERLAEARAQAESSGERYWEAELRRLQGEVLLAAAGDGDRSDRAEDCFHRALEVAGRQGATSLELRSALSLSRLGSSPDAHRLLSEVVGRFTESHDTADLRAAQTQLSLIQPPTVE
jgi:predicted ATPase/DNA-binding winged helix-turn-helix (wHTH) protein